MFQEVNFSSLVSYYFPLVSVDCCVIFLLLNVTSLIDHADFFVLLQISALEYVEFWYVDWPHPAGWYFLQLTKS